MRKMSMIKKYFGKPLGVWLICKMTIKDKEEIIMGYDDATKVLNVPFLKMQGIFISQNVRVMNLLLTISAILF